MTRQKDTETEGWKGRKADGQKDKKTENKKKNIKSQTTN